MIARADVCDIGAYLEDLNAQFVARDPRIAVKRELPQVPADVRSANTDSVNAHQCLASVWARRRIYLDLLEVSRFF
jgi:hypothetical protein